MRDLERGLLPGRSLVRLVDGTRDRLGGRLASGLRVGSVGTFDARGTRSGVARTCGLYVKQGWKFQPHRVRNIC